MRALVWLLAVVAMLAGVFSVYTFMTGDLPLTFALFVVYLLGAVGALQLDRRVKSYA